MSGNAVPRCIISIGVVHDAYTRVYFAITDTMTRHFGTAQTPF